ncbi:MAG: hypothetical protein AB1455_09935 [Pseudomonadota bacterium]
MAQQQPPAAGSGILITEAAATQAFHLWETDFRDKPADYLTFEEVARLEVADLATSRAIHFMALLRQGGAA